MEMAVNFPGYQFRVTRCLGSAAVYFLAVVYRHGRAKSRGNILLTHINIDTSTLSRCTDITRKRPTDMIRLGCRELLYTTEKITYYAIYQELMRFDQIKTILQNVIRFTYVAFTFDGRFPQTFTYNTRYVPTFLIKY